MSSMSSGTTLARPTTTVWKITDAPGYENQPGQNSFGTVHANVPEPNIAQDLESAIKSQGFGVERVFEESLSGSGS